MPPTKKKFLQVTSVQRVPLVGVQEEKLGGFLADAINDTGKVFFSNWGVYDLDPSETHEAEVIEE